MSAAKADYFEHPRYRINKILLAAIGLWPFQSRTESRFFLCVLILVSGVMISAQIRKVIIEGYTLAICLEAIPPFMVDFTCLANLINFNVNSGKLSRLLRRIEEDWREIEGPERKVVERFADEGHMMIIFYSVWLYGSMVFFLALPFIPKVIVALGIANISAPAQFPFPADFYVDTEANYVYLQMEVCTGVILLITTIVSTDAIFVMLVQHACGIFSAVGYRLEHLTTSDDLTVDLNPDRNADLEFFVISDCIRKHNAAIEFVESLDEIFSWSFFFQTGINLAGLSFTAVQFSNQMSNIDEAIRQALLTGGELAHLFFECYFSQRLTDHSLKVYEALKKTSWYITSFRCRTLLNLMIMRSMKPCELKAGKIYTMSMENFSQVIKTAMSYFTILCSMQ